MNINKKWLGLTIAFDVKSDLFTLIRRFIVAISKLVGAWLKLVRYFHKLVITVTNKKLLV